MSLVPVIADFATGTYTVTRTAPGAFTLGRYAPGATSTFSAVMSVQPTGARDQVIMPEGIHYEDAVVCYVAEELHAFDATTGAGDKFTYRGEVYRVFAVEGPWELDGGAHYVARASRQVVP